MMNHRSQHSGMRRFSSLVLVLALVFTFTAMMPTEANAAVKKYNQKKYALKDYNTKKYKVVKNKNFGKKTVKKFDVYNDDESHKMTKLKGNRNIDVETWIHLPMNYNKSGDMGNPQSINVTPDGKYAYVVYPKLAKYNKKDKICRIVRYDLAALKELGVCNPKEVPQPEPAAQDPTTGSDDGSGAAAGYDADTEDTEEEEVYTNDFTGLKIAVADRYRGRTLTDRQKKIMACMKIGPWITMGHGAAVGYNPKDKCLWFTTKTGAKKSDLQRINMKTLKPDLKIDYRFSSYVWTGNNLTFDKKGRVYFFTYSGGGGGYAPKGTIKIYQGKINLKKKKKVTFNLVMTGIRNSASKGIQSMGYNPKLNRLYMVSNSALISVPIDKFGKMKPADVWTVLFKQNREFEGISYDKNGNGYLLVNKRPEILRVSGI